MQTHHVHQQTIDGYLRDLIHRLRSLEADMPTVWCPIGESGQSITRRLFSIDAKLVEMDNVGLLEIDYNSKTREVKFAEEDAAPDLDGKRILVLDDIIYSGITMSNVVQEICKYAPAKVTTYSLVLSQSARFVPSLWGWMVGDHDRVYFPHDEPYPNNRLCPVAPMMHLRAVNIEDIGLWAKNFAPSDRTEHIWARSFEECKNGGPRRTYLLECGSSVVGFVSVHLLTREAMTIEELRIADDSFSEISAKMLIRFAETLARSCDCQTSQIWITEEELETYAAWGYKALKTSVDSSNAPRRVLVARPTAYRVFRD